MTSIQQTGKDEEIFPWMFAWEKAWKWGRNILNRTNAAENKKNLEILGRTNEKLFLLNLGHAEVTDQYTHYIV